MNMFINDHYSNFQRDYKS